MKYHCLSMYTCSFVGDFCDWGERKLLPHKHRFTSEIAWPILWEFHSHFSNRCVAPIILKMHPLKRQWFANYSLVILVVLLNSLQHQCCLSLTRCNYTVLKLRKLKNWDNICLIMFFQMSLFQEQNHDMLIEMLPLFRTNERLTVVCMYVSTCVSELNK